MDITIKINSTNPIDAQARQTKLQAIALLDDKTLALLDDKTLALFHEIATNEKFRKKFVANEKLLRKFV